MPPIEENDLFIVYRDDDTLRKVTLEQMKEEFTPEPPPAPPVKTQDPRISSDNNYTTEPITVTQNAIFINASKTSETWIKDGVDLNVGGNSYTPDDEGSYSFKEVFIGDDGSTVTATSNVLTIEEETDPGEDLTQPTAVMSGLRFDGGRETNLTRTFGIPASYTFSVWFKATDISGSPTILGYDGNNFILQMNNPSVGQAIVGLAGGASITVTHTLVANVWEHFVLSVDNGTCTAYFNGEVAGTGAVGSGAPLTYNFGRGNTASAAQNFNGYMSDAYFVDGQALPPETFGRSFSGKWGPRDNEFVLADIKKGSESPFDQRPNMNEAWSGYAVATPYLNFVGGLFNGTETTNKPAYTWGNESAPVENKNYLTILDGLNLPGNVFQFKADIGAFDWKVRINGTDELYLGNAGTGLASDKLTPPVTVTSGVINKIEIMYYGSGTSLYQFFVDGRELVDGPADNSQNWSSNVTAPDINRGSVENLFDGDPDTSGGRVAASSDPSTADGWTLTFDEPILNATKVEILPYDNAANADFCNSYRVNSEALVTQGQNQHDWIEIYNNPILPITVNSIYCKTQVTSASTYWRGIKINDKLLIDGGTQWDTSQVWSDSVVQTTGTGQYRPSNLAFDGDLNTSTATTPDTDLTFTFNLTAEQVGRVRVYHWGADTSSSQQYSFTLNGSKTSVPSNTVGVRNWLELGDAVAGANTLVMQNLGNPSKGASWAAVEVNGKILVDPGSFGSNGFYLPFDPAAGIGTDDSGKGNDFTAENFAVGNTSQVWSSGGDNSTLYPGSSWEKAFDGSLKTDANISPSTAAGSTCTFPSISGTLRAYVSTDTNSPGGNTCSFILSDGTTVSSGAAYNSPEWISFGDVSNITSINIGSGSTATGASLFAVELDGKLLIDANIQDTVFDTPMRNYAVLESGTNGNLVGSGNPTFQGSAGTTYYYETDGVAVTAEGPITGLPSGTHNFGQQPFADVGPQGDQQLLFQTWQQYARTALGYTQDRVRALEKLVADKQIRISNLETNYAALIARIEAIEADHANMNMNNGSNSY